MDFYLISLTDTYSHNTVPIILFRSKKVMKQHKELNRFIFSKH